MEDTVRPVCEGTARAHQLKTKPIIKTNKEILCKPFFFFFLAKEERIIHNFLKYKVYSLLAFQSGEDIVRKEGVHVDDYEGILAFHLVGHFGDSVGDKEAMESLHWATLM